MNAYEFVLDLADQLVEQGREVEIEEEHDSIRIYASPRTLGETAVGASAHKSPVTGRWNFTGIRAYPLFGDTVKETRRKRAYIIVKVYGRSLVRQEVSA